MKILLDENVHHGFRALLVGHEVFTVQWLGWGSIKNGELIERANNQFDVLITVDRSIRYQNNFSDKKISVITIISKFNQLEHLKPFAKPILENLNHIRPGMVINLSLTDI